MPAVPLPKLLVALLCLYAPESQHLWHVMLNLCTTAVLGAAFRVIFAVCAAQSPFTRCGEAPNLCLLCL